VARLLDRPGLEGRLDDGCHRWPAHPCATAAASGRPAGALRAAGDAPGASDHQPPLPHGSRRRPRHGGAGL